MKSKPETNPVRKLLQGVRDLITPAKRWTSLTYARDRKGQKCMPASDLAVCWCLSGAMSHIGNNAPDDVHRHARSVLKAAACAVFKSETVVEVNDVRGHVAVLRVLDRAIASAQ